MNIGIVVAEFNATLTNKMQQIAEQRARKLGIKINAIVKVPGSFDMPLAIKKLLEREDIDGVATLGAIIQGGTSHDEVIAYSLGNALIKLALEFDKPVSLGVMGPRISREQAEARAERYATHAVDTVFNLHQGLKKYEVFHYTTNQSK